MEYSQAFSERLPTFENRISAIVARSNNRTSTESQILDDASQTRIIARQQVLNLFDDFLTVKLEYGSHIERALYIGMTRKQFIQRLILKRPLSFMGPEDSTLGRDGEMVSNAAKTWPLVGTDHEVAPLLLKDYLSYDEIAIAALFGVSSPTYFINSGARDNMGRPGADGEFTARGVYVGLVGPRFEVPDQMESRFMIASKRYCTAARGYGYHRTPTIHNQAILQMWARFYDCKDQETGIYGFPVCSDTIGSFRFDLYDRRIRLTLETFLLEAEARGRNVNRRVHAFIVGLGLGVWQYDHRQKGAFVEALIATIEILSLPHVHIVEASWVAEMNDRIVVSDNGGQEVTLLFTRGDPAAKREGNDLLVACYAWDGNAFPGNEVWRGSLSASGDPAAVCCSTIGELQNGYVNPFWERIFVVSDDT
jgi:Domain of unknown function (DUF4804)